MVLKIKASDVSDSFTNKAIDEGFPLTIMQALKLTYIAQGFHLALENEEFFQEEAYAWKYGPVIKELYSHLKSISKDNIIQKSQCLNTTFSEKQHNILHVVFSKYTKMDGWALSSLTHRQGTPWQVSYKKEEKSIIPKQMIKEYFKEVIVTKESFILLLFQAQSVANN